MSESIFKNLKLEGFQEISCTKNISDYGDNKSVTICIEYSNGESTLKIGSSCERHKDNSLNETESVKVLHILETGSVKIKLSHRVWQNDLTEIVRKDLDIVDALFDNFRSEEKRVFL